MTTENRDFYDLEPAERECPDCGCDCALCFDTGECEGCDCYDQHDAD